MAEISLMDLYREYRFVVKIGDEEIGFERIWSDPFDPKSCWLVRGHHVDDDTLKQSLDKLDPKQRWVEVTMRSQEGARRMIRIYFKSVDWLPFDLDALLNAPAREHLVLRDVVYDGPFDVGSE